MDLFSPESDTFGPFELEGDFSCEEVFSPAFSRDWNLEANDEFTLADDGELYSLTASEGLNDLLSISLFGRWYARDP